MKSGGRTFDGVKIEGGPSMPSGTVTTLTVCESCYQDEQRRFEQRGAHVRLPAGKVRRSILGGILGGKLRKVVR
jgi:hypothetical protein